MERSAAPIVVVAVVVVVIGGVGCLAVVPVPVMGGTGFEMPIGFWKDSKKHALFIAGEQEARH